MPKKPVSRYKKPRVSKLRRAYIKPSSVEALERIIKIGERIPTEQARKGFYTGIARQYIGGKLNPFLARVCAVAEEGKRISYSQALQKVTLRKNFGSSDLRKVERRIKAIRERVNRLRRLLVNEWRPHYTTGLLTGKYARAFDEVSHSMSTTVLLVDSKLNYVERALYSRNK